MSTSEKPRMVSTDSALEFAQGAYQQGIDDGIRMERSHSKADVVDDEGWWLCFWSPDKGYRVHREDIADPESFTVQIEYSIQGKHLVNVSTYIFAKRMPDFARFHAEIKERANITLPKPVVSARIDDVWEFAKVELYPNYITHEWRCEITGWDDEVYRSSEWHLFPSHALSDALNKTEKVS